MIFQVNEDDMVLIPFVMVNLTRYKNPGDWIILASVNQTTTSIHHTVMKVCYETIVLHSVIGIANNE